MSIFVYILRPKGLQPQLLIMQSSHRYCSLGKRESADINGANEIF